jgi:hypothetical protein
MLLLGETVIGVGSLIGVAVATVGAIRFEQFVRRYVTLA